MTVLQYPEKHVLHQILAQSAIRGEMHKIPEQSPVVAIEKRFQLPNVARPDLLHDGLVSHAPRFRIWIPLFGKKVTTRPVLALRIVNAADIRAFVARDWRLIEELKKDQWLEQKAGM